MDDAIMTPTELRLAEIWGRVLDLEAVAPDEDFFDLGGDSLLATKVVLLARREWDVEFTVRVLLDAPVLKDLAERVDQLVAAAPVPE
ncbi:phosphopantetheine-binding protein [Catenulispora sp. GP43]|uniref:phosphopantetheine-binding protein n=1 Tax=Catenulispora sp. GP43 TaxID=3156263 RepID=UPI0035110174